jgi:hypothetical protein
MFRALGVFHWRAANYRNSIKESISAIESLAKQLAGSQKADLNQALDTMQSRGVPCHPAFKSAIKKMHGYTSDEPGIRHALFEEDDIRFEDAQVMLVCCSAFINYLIAKSSDVQ